MAIKKNLLSKKLTIDSIASASHILKYWMKEGVFFFHQGRCGSRVVADLLGQHPKISSYKEIFNKYFQINALPADPKNMLLEKRVRAFTKYAVVEAKFFECQHLSLLEMGIDEFIDFLKSCGFYKFIILDRQNYLRKIVSALISKKRGGKWHYKTNDMMPKITTIRIDVEKVSIQGKKAPIVELFEYMDEQYYSLRRKLEGEDVLELTYEKDIFKDPLVAYNKVCQWLNIKNALVKVKYKKTNVMELNKSIENWNQVAGALSNSPYVWMVQLN